MNPDLQNLIELQKLDDEIRELEAEVAALPRRIAEIESQLTGHIRQIESDKNALAENQKSRRRCEGEIAGLREKISHFKDQSLAVKTNEQYKALLHEIEYHENAIRQVEDKILTEMMESEKLDARVRAAEQSLAVERKHVAAEVSVAQQRKSEDEEQLRLLREQRAAVQGRIAIDLYENYERVANFRKGRAVAPVRDGNCSACGVRLRPQAFSELTANERIITCESCYRILYYAPEPVPMPAENAG